MLKRTTVSLERNYLDVLKFLALKQEKTFSQLVNEAVRAYISKIKLKGDNRKFFDYLMEVKKEAELSLTKKELTTAINEGRG